MISAECREMSTLLFERGYRFNTDTEWAAEQDRARRWFARVKLDESLDTFEKAFQENRLTMRGIKEDRQEGFYVEKVKLRGAPETEGGVREIKTMQGIDGLKARMNHDNFASKTARKKYDQGLFDVSATLLDGKRTLKIGGEGKDKNQMYRLTGDTTYVFMPVSSQEDMVIFFMLNVLSKRNSPGSPGFKTFVQYMKSRLTRIKFAFEGDAGATFRDFAPKGDAYLPKFRYGFGNIMGAESTDKEIKERKLAALEYKKVLLGNNRNEIIVAYRQHGLLSMPSTFPIYARGVFADGKHKGYVVVDDTNRNPTGEIINFKGLKSRGRAEDLGGEIAPKYVKQKQD